MAPAPAGVVAPGHLYPDLLSQLLGEMRLCRTVDNQCLVVSFGQKAHTSRAADGEGICGRALPAAPLPAAHTAEGVSGRVLIIGGGGYDALSPHEALDLATDVWMSSVSPVRALAGLQALAYFPISGWP
jgi:hypothetical protein